jgi:MoaA/NifB/PqqE/SkfB family radical SAM enzyme
MRTPGKMIRHAVKTAKHLTFIRRPRVLARVARGYVRGMVLGRDVLRSIEFSVTYACQARCHKCYAADLGDDERRRLSVEQIRGVIDQALPLGLIHVNLTGGEPTLRKDLPEIVRACRPDRVVVSLVTNSLSLTREKLHSYRQAGLNTIQISLDSADAETHDRLRGVPGCFDQVLRAAAWARELGINLCFSTVLSTEADSDQSAMQRLLDLAEREDAFLLLCDSAAVGGWDGQCEKMFSREDRNRVLAELLKHPRARHHSMYNFRGRSGCPAGVEKIYVTAYGDVTPCDLVHDVAGNILSEELDTIWQRMRTHPLYARKVCDCVRYHEDFEDRRSFCTSANSTPWPSRKPPIGGTQPEETCCATR